jgi:hypothetical protein
MKIKAYKRDKRKMGSKNIDGITKFLRVIDVCNRKHPSIVTMQNLFD